MNFILNLMSSNSRLSFGTMSTRNRVFVFSQFSESEGFTAYALEY